MNTNNSYNTLVGIKKLLYKLLFFLDLEVFRSTLNAYILHVYVCFSPNFVHKVFPSLVWIYIYFFQTSQKCPKKSYILMEHILLCGTSFTRNAINLRSHYYNKLACIGKCFTATWPFFFFLFVNWVIVINQMDNYIKNSDLSFFCRKSPNFLFL